MILTHKDPMTLDLKRAAEYLHLHPVTVQDRAKRGMIPGAAKPGKCWVFLEEGLRAYLISLSPCPSIELAKSGMLTSPLSGGGYVAQLLPRTGGRRRRTTTG